MQGVPDEFVCAGQVGEDRYPRDPEERGRRWRVAAPRPNGANLGFEQQLWAAADKLRGHMDAAEYKHVVLGLIFLKYISDAFEEKHAALVAEAERESEHIVAPAPRRASTPKTATSTAENVFWVPNEARWSYLQATPSSPRSAS